MTHPSRPETKPFHRIPVKTLPLLLLAAFLACDIPETISRPRREGPIRITTGPYLVHTPGGKLLLRFETNRPATAGLRRRDDDTRRMVRYSSAGTRHEIGIGALLTGTDDDRERYTLYLEDREALPLELRGRPAAGARASLCVLGGGGDPALVARAAERLAREALDGVVVLPELRPDRDDLRAWRERFFAPLQPLLAEAPLFFVPSYRKELPEPLFPAIHREMPVRTYEIGSVWLVVADAALLRSIRTQGEALRAIERALEERPASAPWAVVAFSEPLFGVRHVNARAVEALDALLERTGVTLAVSGGAPYYHRTLPLEVPGEAQAVHYAVTGGLGETDLPGGGRQYTAAMAAEPHVCVIEASLDGLTWRTETLSGGTIDLVRFDAGGIPDTGEPVLDKREVLNEALAELTLREEIRTVARQACRAVEDPGRPGRLPVILQNPTSTVFRGELVWEIPAGSAFTPYPERIPFELESGLEATTRFDLEPGTPGGPMPRFVVSGAEIGYTRQELVLTTAKETRIPYTDESCTVDGRLDEAFWAEAARLEDFAAVITGEEPSRIFRASLIATPEGLCLATVSEAEQATRIEATVDEPDGPVHRDESVELFIDPEGRGREYLQFATNLQGGTREEPRQGKLDRSSRLGLRWDPPWERRVLKSRDYYQVEIRIPWRSLGQMQAPVDGTRMGLNMTRNDYAAARAWAKQDRDERSGDPPAPEVIQWAQTMGSNARSGCYGTVVFVRSAE
jgi:hypothetical protein